jgi:hyperosmotically inducible periplasmic protein
MNKRCGFLFFSTAIALTMAVGGCNKAPETAAGNISDIDVSAHVKTALLESESLKGMDITVVTRKGDVRLIGVLDTQTQIDEAVKLARAAEGVHAIHDELVVKK